MAAATAAESPSSEDGGVTTTTTTTVATTTASSSTPAGWLEFCERHAAAAAQDFSRSCIRYIAVNLPENARATVTHRDFLKKFVEAFSEQFEMDFCRRRQTAGGSKYVNGVGGRHSNEEVSDGANSETEDGSPKLTHKPFFRRLVLLLH